MGLNFKFWILGVIACTACSSPIGGGEVATDETFDTDTAETQDTGTQPVIEPDTEIDTDTDTGPVTGSICEQPFEIAPYEALILTGYHWGYQNEDNYDFSGAENCWHADCQCVEEQSEWVDWCNGQGASDPNCFDCFTDPARMCRAGGVEHFIKVEMTTGQTMKFRDVGGGERKEFRLIAGCDEPFECSYSLRKPSWYQFEYTALEDGVHTFVIESASSPYGMANAHFHFEIGVYDDTETDCSDGLDNDGNGLADCLDPVCTNGCATAQYLMGPENFNSQLPASWTVPPGSWVWSDGDTYPYHDDVNGDSGGGVAGFLNVKEDDYTAGVALEGAEVVLSGETSVALVFAQFLDYRLTSDFPAYFEVQVSVDDGAWQTAKRFDHRNTERRRFQNGFEILDISALVSGGSKFKFRFYFNETGYQTEVQWTTWVLDDVFVVGGDFSIIGAEDPNLPEEKTMVSGATGCEGSEPKCENLFGQDFGDCGQSLGFYFDGQQCQEAFGCAGGSFCFYPDAPGCAKACAAAGECNMESFNDENWPPQGEYTLCPVDIVVCTTQDQHPSSSNSVLNDMYPKASVDDTRAQMCAMLNWADTTVGGVFSIEGPPLARMDEEAWEYLCGYSLLPGHTQFACVQASAGF